jgi:glycosyltransferase involved in cell wall biosynthesis
LDYPLISIVIPFFNKSLTIQRSINSIIEQTYNNWEILIIDDASNPKLDVNFLSNDSRIKILTNSSNKGAAYSRQIGFINSNGVYIAFLDADDWWDNRFLELCVAELSKKNVNDGVYVISKILNNDNSFSLRRYSEYHHVHIRETIIQYSRPWQTGGILWRRESCGSWGSLRTHEDSWFEITSSKNNFLQPVFGVNYYVDMRGDNHLSKNTKLNSSTKDQQELFLMVKKDFWKKLSIKYKLILLHRLIRGQFKIMEYCSLNEVNEYRRKLFKESISLGLLSYSKFLLKITHKILQNSPYKIHY